MSSSDSGKQKKKKRERERKRQALEAESVRGPVPGAPPPAASLGEEQTARLRGTHSYLIFYIKNCRMHFIFFPLILILLLIHDYTYRDDDGYHYTATTATAANNNNNMVPLGKTICPIHFSFIYYLLYYQPISLDNLSSLLLLL